MYYLIYLICVLISLAVTNQDQCVYKSASHSAIWYAGIMGNLRALIAKSENAAIYTNN